MKRRKISNHGEIHEKFSNEKMHAVDEETKIFVFIFFRLNIKNI